MNDTARPIAKITVDSQEYWDSLRGHECKLQRCLDCRAFRFYPGPLCHDCASTATEWVPITGTGTVHSYTVVHRAAVGAFAKRMPFTIVLVTLDEGPTMMANLCHPDGTEHVEGLYIGMPVRLAYEDVNDHVTLPVFVAETGAANSAAIGPSPSVETA